MIEKEINPIETGKLHGTPINKCKWNPAVNLLLEINYSYLFKLLVRTDLDQDIFGDVILSMTYKYRGEDFVEEFKKEFKSHKTRHRKAEIINKMFFKTYDHSIYSIVDESEEE